MVAFAGWRLIAPRLGGKSEARRDCFKSDRLLYWRVKVSPSRFCGGRARVYFAFSESYVRFVRWM